MVENIKRIPLKEALELIDELSESINILTKRSELLRQYDLKSELLRQYDLKIKGMHKFPFLYDPFNSFISLLKNLKEEFDRWKNFINYRLLKGDQIIIK